MRPDLSLPPVCRLLNEAKDGQVKNSPLWGKGGMNQEASGNGAKDQSSQVSLPHLAICLPVFFSFLSPTLHSCWILTWFQNMCPHYALLLLVSGHSHQSIPLTSPSHSPSHHYTNLLWFSQISLSPSSFPDSHKWMHLLLHLVPIALYVYQSHAHQNMTPLWWPQSYSACFE